jgi:hypothetical protein
MLNQETENVKLTFEQLRQIDVVQKRLSNLESEITIATKNLNALKKDTDRIYKEKMYQEELLANLTTQTDTKKLELIKLGESITEHSNILNKLITEYKEHTEKMTIEKDEHSVKGERISKKEIELNEKSSELNEKLKEYEINVSCFFSKVAKLKDLISSF